MPRIDVSDLRLMTDAQRKVYDATVSGTRGKAPAPLRAWLASPTLAMRAQSLGEFLRYQTSVPATLSELAILITARHWNASFEWYAHKREALRAGLRLDLIMQIARRDYPANMDEREAVVYELVKQLLEEKGVKDGTYHKAVALLNKCGVVELVGIVGYYAFVAMTLNTFQIGIPEGEVDDFANLQ